MEKMMSSKELFGYAAGICENPGEAKNIMHDLMIVCESEIQNFPLRLNLAYNANLLHTMPHIFGLFGEAYRRAAIVKQYEAIKWSCSLDDYDWEDAPNHYELPDYVTVYEEFCRILSDYDYFNLANEMVDWTYNVYKHNFKTEIGLAKEEVIYPSAETIRKIARGIMEDIHNMPDLETKKGAFAACRLLMKAAYYEMM